MKILYTALSAGILLALFCACGDSVTNPLDHSAQIAVQLTTEKVDTEMPHYFEVRYIARGIGGKIPLRFEPNGRGVFLVQWNGLREVNAALTFVPRPDSPDYACECSWGPLHERSYPIEVHLISGRKTEFRLRVTCTGN